MLAGCLDTYLPAGGVAGTAVDAATVATGGGSLTYAEINGTIIAIIFAALAGYALIVFESLDKMTQEILDGANDLLSPVSVIAAEDPELPIDNLPRDELLQLALNAALGVRAPVANGVVIEADQLALRGKAVIAGTRKVLFEYPFRTPPLVNMKEVQAWLKDYNETIVRLQGIFVPGAMTQAERARIMQAADEEIDVRLAAFENLAPEARVFMDEFRGEFSRQNSALQKLVENLASAHYKLFRQISRMQRYRQRVIPPRQVQWVIAIALLTTFVCGVASPMVNTDTPDAVAAWVPVALYTVGVVTALAYFVRKLQ